MPVQDDKLSYPSSAKPDCALPYPAMPVQDHKRAFEGDLGPNTSGMGAYSCADHLLPFLSLAALEEAQLMNEACVAALKKACAIMPHHVAVRCHAMAWRPLTIATPSLMCSFTLE